MLFLQLLEVYSHLKIKKKIHHAQWLSLLNILLSAPVLHPSRCFEGWALVFSSPGSFLITLAHLWVPTALMLWTRSQASDLCGFMCLFYFHSHAESSLRVSDFIFRDFHFLLRSWGYTTGAQLLPGDRLINTCFTEPGLSQAFNCLLPSSAPVKYSLVAACLRQTYEEVREHGAWSRKSHWAMDLLLHVHIVTALNVPCL